jgi:hypothetical protein
VKERGGGRERENNRRSMHGTRNGERGRKKGGHDGKNGGYIDGKKKSKRESALG